MSDEIKTFENILAEHHKYGAGILKWGNIRRHLIDQIHHKKCELVRNKYKILPGTKTKRIYDVVLFLGKKSQNEFDTWPCEFKNQMENALCEEISCQEPNDFNEIDVYYNVGGDMNPFKDIQNELLAFNVDEWSLDASSEMTEHDLHVIKSFIDQFSAFLDALLSKMTSIIAANEHRRCTSEVKRIKKLFDSVNALFK